MHEVETIWKDEMTFTSTVNGHEIVFDATPELGGKDKGPRPKPLLLAALTGCTGMDVVAILAKMQVKIDGFRITAKADIAEEHPKVYSRIEMLYEFSGTQLPKAKIRRAVELSQDKYCAVSAMLRETCPLSYDISYME
ncbi:MAG: OsmC family protein [Spirochaetes bacterium]|nr:OsmC family protein [Spirochaetota bacterium]